jgi:hypothetical protein
VIAKIGTILRFLPRLAVRGTGGQISDDRHCRSLRPRGKRRGSDSATKDFDEISSSHCPSTQDKTIPAEAGALEGATRDVADVSFPYFGGSS